MSHDSTVALLQFNRFSRVMFVFFTMKVQYSSFVKTMIQTMSQAAWRKCLSLSMVVRHTVGAAYGPLSSRQVSCISTDSLYLLYRDTIAPFCGRICNRGDTHLGGQKPCHQYEFRSHLTLKLYWYMNTASVTLKLKLKSGTYNKNGPTFKAWTVLVVLLNM